MPRSLIVFERKPRWFPELQRRFSDSGFPLVVCSAVNDVEQALRSGEGVVMLVMDGAEDRCLEVLRRCSRLPTPPRTIVMGTRHSTSLEWPVRELGVQAFVTERIVTSELVDLCRRLIAD